MSTVVKLQKIERTSILNKLSIVFLNRLECEGYIMLQIVWRGRYGETNLGECITDLSRVSEFQTSRLF